MVSILVDSRSTKSAFSLLGVLTFTTTTAFHKRRFAMRKLTAALLLTLIATIAQAQFIQPKVYNLSSGGLNLMMAKGDFNGDSKLDVLFSASNITGQPELAVFPGNGTGGFTAAIVTPVTANKGRIITAGDVNGDGIPDIIITAVDSITAQAEVGVMLADGSGKFGAAILFHTSLIPLVLGDFTGDGKTDLVVGSSPLTVFPGNGDGTFGAAIASSFNWGGNCAAVADYNKDNKLDLTTGNAVLLGNGDGTFQSPLTVTGGPTGGFCSIAIGDLNKDGIPDLVTAGGRIGGVGALVFLGDGTGKFTTSTLYKTGQQGITGIVVDSFNADSNPDIAVSNYIDDDVAILVGNGAGKFTIGKTFALSDGGILSGDFNGDHKTDLAVFSNHGFSVLLGNGTGGLVSEVAQNFQPGSTIHLADFNGDGKVDAFEFGQPGAVLLGNGAGAFGAPIPVPSSCHGGAGVIVDFNDDKKPDVAFVEGTGGGVGLCLGKGDGTFKDAIVSDAGVQHSGLVFGDFNHDGKMDLAATDSGGLSILLGNGDGTFKSAILIALNSIVFTATGDFNHDGKLDIAAILNTSNGPEIAILLGNGDGTFKSPVITSSPNAGWPFVVGDLNGDGILDIVTPGVYVFIGNGDGTFKTPVFHNVAGIPLQLRDINNDGKLDVLAVAGLNGFFEVVLGNGNGTFQAPKIYSALLGRVSLGVADLNGDGKLDIAYLRSSNHEKTSTLEVFLNGH